MPTEMFAETQVKEVRFTKREIVALVLENVQTRMSTSYDFDYSNPFVKWLSDGGLVFRFVQQEVIKPEQIRDAVMSPIDKHVK